MNEKDILIGVLARSGECCPVYYNPTTGEVYYYDEQSLAYLLTGFEMKTPPATDIYEGLDALMEGLDENVVGVVIDGKQKWLLTDDMAYLCAGDAINTDGAVESHQWDDSMEYDDESDGEE